MSELFVKFEDGDVYVEGEQAFNLTNTSEILDYVEHLLNNQVVKWVDITEGQPVEGKYYWVQFPDGEIKMCQYNDYKQYGGHSDYWQGDDRIDVKLKATKFIEIIKPEGVK